MMNGWPRKRLETIVTRLTNGYVGPTRDIYVETGVPYLLARHVRSNELAFDGKTFITAEFNEKHKKSKLKAGDVLLVQSGHIGHSAVVSKDHEGHNCHAMIVITPDPCEVSGDFLSLFFNSPAMQEKFEDIRSGSTVPHLTCREVRELEIPVPPLAEQQRIVGILDEAFEGIATAKANAEKNLQNARALFESHLESLFTQRGEGWVEVQLSDVCERLHQGLNTAGEKVKFYDTGYPIIQTRNIDHGVVELDTKMKFMCEEDWQRYKEKYRPEVGDVFFTNIGTIGKTAIVTVDRDYLIHWNIFKLRPHCRKVTSEFLRYTLEQLTLSGYFAKLQKGGTVDFVTKKMISEAVVYLPPLSEQRLIVAVLDTLREETLRLATIYERKLAALDELKKSLLHRAFSGEL